MRRRYCLLVPLRAAAHVPLALERVTKHLHASMHRSVDGAGACVGQLARTAEQSGCDLCWEGGHLFGEMTLLRSQHGAFGDNKKKVGQAESMPVHSGLKWQKFPPPKVRYPLGRLLKKSAQSSAWHDDPNTNERRSAASDRGLSICSWIANILV